MKSRKLAINQLNLQRIFFIEKGFILKIHEFEMVETITQPQTKNSSLCHELLVFVLPVPQQFALRNLHI